MNTSNFDNISRPFPADVVEIKPGAFSKERSRALALAYVDARGYMERLDEVVGPENWTVSYQITPHGVICTLTVAGVIRQDVGDFPSDPAAPAQATAAAAQAFKRACAALGLGRYLYRLPQVWGDFDERRNTFVDPRGIVIRLYQEAGLADFIPPAWIASRKPAALADPASDLSQQATSAQIGLISSLLRKISDREAHAFATRMGLPALTPDRDALAGLGLTKAQASAIIGALRQRSSGA